MLSDSVPLVAKANVITIIQCRAAFLPESPVCRQAAESAFVVPKNCTSQVFNGPVRGSSRAFISPGRVPPFFGRPDPEERRRHVAGSFPQKLKSLNSVVFGKKLDPSESVVKQVRHIRKDEAYGHRTWSTSEPFVLF
jgi:hypothetical protein